ADDLAQRRALADQFTESARFDNFFFQIFVLLFELIFELLNFLKRARAGNRGTNMVGENLYPWMGLTRRMMVEVAGGYSKKLSFVCNGRTHEATNIRCFQFLLVGDMWPVSVRIAQDHPCRPGSDLAEQPDTHFYERAGVRQLNR